MSLTEALRAGDPEVFGLLYDEHAGRLHAYCRVMVGDEADDAVRDAFIAAARHPGTVPDDEALPVWLYALARTECLRRGSLVRKAPLSPSAEPLLRAVARLRAEHREVLALSGTLTPLQIARVMGLALDTTELLIRVAQRRLDQAAASVLGERAVRDEAMLTALGTGKLYKLVGGPSDPPAGLRTRVLTSCAEAERAADGALLFDHDGMPIQLDGLFGRAEEPTHPMRVVSAGGRHAAPDSVDVPRRGSRPSRHAKVTVSHARPGRSTRSERSRRESRRHDGLFEVLGLAACVTAAASVLALWPAPHDNGSTNMDGTSLLLHRGAAASRTLQPSASGDTPPQNATVADAKKTPTPSPSATATTTSPVVPPPQTGVPATVPSSSSPTPTQPPASPTPVDSSPATPTPTPTPSTPTPTPSPAP